jgi:hypothetical protein
MKNYTIIRLVSILEDFFKILVCKLVDVNDLPLFPLYKSEASIPIGILNEMFQHEFTKGVLIANHFNFANYKEVNDVFTNLLRSHEQFAKTKFDFFGAIKKIYWYDPPMHPRGNAPNDEIWHKFEIMFEIRNDIIHHMKYANLPIQEIFFLCDHTLNIADIASYLSMLPEMNEIVRMLESKQTKMAEISQRDGVYIKRIIG